MIKIKLKNPVNVDLFKFVTKGEFDYIENGQTKEWILNNFPDPDQIGDMGHGLSVWLYGRIEFHFDKEILFSIWCDNFIDFTAGKNIKLDKWIFNDVKKFNLTTSLF